MQVEIGLKVVSAGFSGYEGPEWARAIEREIEEAVGQGTKLCQQIASLRPFRSHFSITRAHLLLLQNQVKACPANLKREINCLNAPVDIAHSRGDKQISTLGFGTPRLQVLMRAKLWELVGETCTSVEETLRFAFEEEMGQRDAQQTDGETNHSGSRQESTSSSSDTDPTPLLLSMKIHVLILSVLYHIRISNSKFALTRLTALHDLLDSDALENFPAATFHVTCTVDPPFHLNVKHPNILYELAFLVSGMCKRDVVRRKPKRKVFVKEGLGVCFTLEGDDHDQEAALVKRGQIYMKRKAAEKLEKVVHSS